MTNSNEMTAIVKRDGFIFTDNKYSGRIRVAINVGDVWVYLPFANELIRDCITLQPTKALLEDYFTLQNLDTPSC